VNHSRQPEEKRLIWMTAGSTDWAAVVDEVMAEMAIVTQLNSVMQQ